MNSGEVEDKVAAVEISVTGVPGECACFDGNLLPFQLIWHENPAVRIILEVVVER